MELNRAILVSVLVGSGRLGDVNMGKGIHVLIFKHEGEFGVVCRKCFFRSVCEVGVFWTKQSGSLMTS